MAFKHFGINVPDAVAMAKWYVENLDMNIVCSTDSPPYTHFLADSTSRTIIKIYSNPNDPIPGYSAQHHLRSQIAFATNDPCAIKEKLIKAGASLVLDETTEDGSQVITLRDPWNIPFQLAKRTLGKEDKDGESKDRGRDLVLIQSEAAVLYVSLEETLAELDSIKYGPCPENLVELTMARAKKKKPCPRCMKENTMKSESSFWHRLFGLPKTFLIILVIILACILALINFASEISDFFR